MLTMSLSYIIVCKSPVAKRDAFPPVHAQHDHRKVHQKCVGAITILVEQSTSMHVNAFTEKKTKMHYQIKGDKV